MNPIWLSSKWARPFVACGFVLFVITSCVVYRMVEQLDGMTRRRGMKDGSFLLPLVHLRHNPQSFGHRNGVGSSNSKTDEELYYIRLDSLRYRYEQNHSMTDHHIATLVQQLRKELSIQLPTNPKMSYDIYNCPSKPPLEYPMEWNLIQILTNWNPDHVQFPPSTMIYQGLCVFDWNRHDHRPLLEVYRRAEVPFVLQNYPDLLRTAERWSHKGYLSKLVGPGRYRNEYAHNSNHLMYWKAQGRGARRLPDGWKPPTQNVELTFDEWYAKAMELEHATVTTSVDHWYFRLNGDSRQRGDFLYDELPIFLPTKQTLFMVEPNDQRGINCRFGMKGVIAETHYDFSRNWIVMLGGQKRYILSHPKQCFNLELYPVGHPSARHSRINWSDPKDWQTGRFPQAMANEVILQPGDAMYLPTSWFHFIVSLNLNYQCNARSGTTFENRKVIADCGFPM